MLNEFNLTFLNKGSDQRLFAFGENIEFDDVCVPIE